MLRLEQNSQNSSTGKLIAVESERTYPSEEKSSGNEIGDGRGRDEKIEEEKVSLQEEIRVLRVRVREHREWIFRE